LSSDERCDCETAEHASSQEQREVDTRRQHCEEVSDAETSVYLLFAGGLIWVVMGIVGLA
jgi:hypothetical protein